jgi:hypothetical protein
MSFSIILHTLINSKNMFTILLIIDTDNKNTMMLCPFIGPKMFCAGPNFLSQPKNLFTHCTSYKHFVLDKKWFAFSKIGFCAGTKVLEKALHEVKCLGWLKQFGPAQIILGPVKGQGIRGNKNMNYT